MMNTNLCPYCGGDFEYYGGKWKCRFCGSYKPDDISSEEVTLLYTASQKLRLADFDEAEREFDDMIRKYPKNPHAYWGRLMARYGIKYEDDYDGSKIPSCYATSIESIYSAGDYKEALQYADKENKNFYQKQAEYIESVRKEWVEKASKEKPYDIFICYKESDLANGIQRTEDSIAMQDLFGYLKDMGYRVFYSHDSLRNKAGEKYEPYIFNALSTAKVMLVYGSKPDYINSVWLKNEWMRYLGRMHAGEKKQGSLLVAYKGFSPYELPRALASLQCFDAGDRRFFSDLAAAIVRIIGEQQPKDAFSSPTNTGSPEVPQTLSSSAEEAIRQAMTKPATTGLAFDLSRDGTWFLLTGLGTCEGGELVIPKSFRYPGMKRDIAVTTVRAYAFQDCNHITSLVIPDSIEGIADFAFQSCQGLTSVVILGGHTHIQKGVFADCARLTRVILPDGIQKIGTRAFEGCHDLTCIEYAGTVKHWKKVTLSAGWHRHSGIKTVKCSDGVIKIGLFS